jgi:hypothetical protein
MANITITQLPSAGAITGSELVPIVQNGVTVKTTASTLISGSGVASVSGTAPVVSSGGTTPAISMPAASTSVNGYLSSTDWNVFNNKPTTSGTSILYGNGTGGFSNVTIGAGISFVAGTISTSAGGGTVTSVAALTLGTAGTDLTSTVATATTTPVITLNVPTASASNRGALSAADWTTFNGKVTSVSGTAPVVSSGGATPAISMAAATTSVDGYLTSADWTTFNGKGIGSVTSVGWTGGIVSVATQTSTPAFTIAGTSGGIPYFSSGTTWATSAALTASAIMIGGGAGVAPATTTTGTGVVTALGVNTGSVGAFLVNGGALGTPSGGTVTNLTGTASININGTVGATTATTGAFTTVTATTGIFGGTF